MISIFSVINEVAVLGTTCVVMAVHTLWYALPVSSPPLKSDSTATAKQAVSAVVLPFISFLCMFGLTAYALSFATLLGVTTLQIGSACALFGVAAQLSVYSANEKPIATSMNHAGFMIISIMCGAFVLQYWPW